jgi:hypothetical protein
MDRDGLTLSPGNLSSDPARLFTLRSASVPSSHSQPRKNRITGSAMNSEKHAGNSRVSTSELIIDLDYNSS